MSILASSTPEYFSRQVRNARRFYLDLRVRRSSLTVVCGGWERCASDYVLNRDTFPWFALEFVAAGRLSAQLGAHAYTLGPGSVFSYGPGIAQRLAPISREPLLKYFVNFGGRLAPRLLRKAGLSPGSVREVGDSPAVREIMDALISAGLKLTSRSESVCSHLVEALVLAIGDAGVEHGSASMRSYATYQRCRSRVIESGGELSSLQEAASVCHVDAAYLCRLFARYDRETPYQLIQRLRLQQAAGLLMQPGALVKTVAKELGFADPFHFSRAFKRHFGVPPAEVIRGTANNSVRIAGSAHLGPNATPWNSHEPREEPGGRRGRTPDARSAGLGRTGACRIDMKSR
jgi:AraC-like DNA-binding protein